MQNKSPLKQLQACAAKFEKEALFNPEYAELDITSVFIDHKDKVRRAVIIIEENEDLKAANDLAARYFEGHPFKVISREGKPEGTANLTNGTGIKRNGSTNIGSFGGVFQRSDGHLYGLSNNHVIANLNNANVGDPIMTSSNALAGTLFNWITLMPPPHINKIDAALFKIDPGNTANWTPHAPTGAVGAKVNLKVYKKGCATGLTNGYVTGIGSSQVQLNGVLYNFSNIISIKGFDGDFNKPGDSGSVVLTTVGNYSVAIVFAKFGDFCWTLPISQIGPLLG